MSKRSGTSRSARGGKEGAPSPAVGKRAALDVERILRWADAHRTATGRWPDRRSGAVVGPERETWAAINSALRKGHRGLPGGSSLARFLAEERGITRGANPEAPAERLRAWAAEQIPTPRPRRLARSAKRLVSRTRLTIDLILSWADAHHEATGNWPRVESGPVRDHPEMKWANIHQALNQGNRGLPGGTTLARLLHERRGVRSIGSLPGLDVEQILAWADAHREATGEWPNRSSGPVAAAPGRPGT